MLDYVYVAIGLFLLFVAGDALVRGSVSAGLRLNIPAILIGLTIVAFGTSAPELFVTIQASLAGEPEIAVGNVVGSNIANVLLVLGLPALLGPMSDHSASTQRNYLIMLGVTAVAVVMAMTAPLTYWHGVTLLGLLGLFLWSTYLESIQARRSGHDAALEEEVAEEGDPTMPWWKIGGLVLAGLIGLPLGADLTVDSGIVIAQRFGLSEATIGLTLVAIGTSLPELATTLVAAIRGRADVAMGNVIGSNIFNLLCILGIAATLDNLEISADFIALNFTLMSVAALVLLPFIFGGRSIGRITGGVFVALYCGYLVVLLNQSQMA